VTAALDSNIIVDVLTSDSENSPSEQALMALRAKGDRLIIGEAVYGELSGRSATQERFEALLAELHIAFVPSSTAALYRAGEAWRLYTSRRPDGLQCPACGTRNGAPRCEGCGESLRPRQHIVADFLVGAHALEHADRLLTRDRGFYAAYFPELRLA